MQFTVSSFRYDRLSVNFVLKVENLPDHWHDIQRSHRSRENGTRISSGIFRAQPSNPLSIQLGSVSTSDVHHIPAGGLNLRAQCAAHAAAIRLLGFSAPC